MCPNIWKLHFLPVTWKVKGTCFNTLHLKRLGFFSAPEGVDQPEPRSCKPGSHRYGFDGESELGTCHLALSGQMEKKGQRSLFSFGLSCGAAGWRPNTAQEEDPVGGSVTAPARTAGQASDSEPESPPTENRPRHKVAFASQRSLCDS